MYEEMWNVAVENLKKRRAEQEVAKNKLQQERKEFELKQSLQQSIAIANEIVDTYSIEREDNYVLLPMEGSCCIKEIAINTATPTQYEYPVNAKQIISMLEAAGYNIEREDYNANVDCYRIS